MSWPPLNGDNWIGTGIALLLGLIALLAIQWLSRPIGRALRNPALPDERVRQLRTLLQVTRWTLTLLIVSLMLLTILSRWINILPLVASLGVAGLALGLGAQTLVKDFLGGMFILLENQFNVGDTIQLAAVTGEVEQVTLRATWIRDVEGVLHIVPNGEIRTVANMTKDWSRALVPVEIACEEDLNRAAAVLSAAAQEVTQAPDFVAAILEPPQLLGPTLGRGTVSYTITVKTRPGKQVLLQRALQAAVIQQLKQADISTAPRQEIVLHKVPPRTE